MKQVFLAPYRGAPPPVPSCHLQQDHDLGIEFVKKGNYLKKGLNDPLNGRFPIILSSMDGKREAISLFISRLSKTAQTKETNVKKYNASLSAKYFLANEKHKMNFVLDRAAADAIYC